jgi:hypothetical protein
MRGTIPPLPNTPLYRGAQLKKSTGTALLYCYRSVCFINTHSVNLWSMSPVIPDASSSAYSLYRVRHRNGRLLEPPRDGKYMLKVRGAFARG